MRDEDRTRSTIAVHPEGGVIAVTQRSNLEIAIICVGRDGRVNWQARTTVNWGGWDAEPHAHVSIDDGSNVIVSLPSSLIGLYRDGTLWMQRAPGELGFARFGAILRDPATPGHILVGGWGTGGEREPVRPFASRGRSSTCPCRNASSNRG